MSYAGSLLVQCENIQEKVVQAFGVDHSIAPYPTSFLEFIMSETNTREIVQQVSPGRGKARNVTVTYFQRIQADEVVEEYGRNCEVTDQRGNLSETYEIDTEDVLTVGEKINAADLTRFCDDNPIYIASRLLSLLNAMDGKISKRVAAEAALLRGNFSKYVTTDTDTFTITSDKLKVKTKDSTSGHLIPGASENITTAAELSLMNGFVGFGGSALREYFNFVAKGCCASQGVDVGEIYREFGFFYGYDPELAKALGSIAYDSLIMRPGALQLLTYTQSEWKEGVSPAFTPGGYMSFATVTPAGVPVDVIITDNCPGEIGIKVIANVRLVGLPADMFGSGDEYEGVTGVAGVVVDNS